MDKIQIVNFLLTRRCNLHCSYCRISRDYRKPGEYPDLQHYIKNEISTTRVIEFLYNLKRHNPDSFIIFYGGEPLYRKDLPEIINYCNDNDINYTIITNNSKEVQPLLKKLFNKTKFISGLTSSVDPILYDPSATGDIYRKSKEGLENLIKFKSSVKDLVAEITVTPNTINYLIPLVRELTKNGISSSITFVDIAKSDFYDFSNITDEDLVVNPTRKTLDILKELYSDQSLDIHMRDQLLLFPDILPSNLDCKIEENIHNISIDADGSIRLCLRIRSVLTPNYFNTENIFTDNNSIDKNLINTMKEDKKLFCKKCNWTCMLMSNLVNQNKKLTLDLIHIEKRNK